MGTITAYKLVRNVSLDTVVSEVQRLVKEGWQPHGDVSFLASNLYTQAVVRVEAVPECELDLKNIRYNVLEIVREQYEHYMRNRPIDEKPEKILMSKATYNALSAGQSFGYALYGVPVEVNEDIAYTHIRIK